MQWKVACSLGLLGLMTGTSVATPIYIDSVGREWLDVNDSRYRSWEDTAAVCDALTGACSGTLATHDSSSSDIDLSGYRWAARDEVRDLFYEIGGLPFGALDDYAETFDVTTGYGANAFDIFEPTIQLPAGPGVLNILNGVTRDRFFDSDLMIWRAYSGIISNPSFGSGSFTLNGGLPTSIREISMGAYLYRDVAVGVPEPGTLALFAFPLAVLFALRARNRRKKSVFDSYKGSTWPLQRCPTSAATPSPARCSSRQPFGRRSRSWALSKPIPSVLPHARKT